MGLFMISIGPLLYLIAPFDLVKLQQH